MNVVLVSPYELGRQPFGLAQPAAWLAQAGHSVTCIDLSLQKLERESLESADLVALYLAMHTATRIAVDALPKIREAAPGARLCAYGLYAPVNAQMLQSAGIDYVLGGEFEPALTAIATALEEGNSDLLTTQFATNPPSSSTHLEKVKFVVPDRSGLPPLSRYASLIMPDGTSRTTGFAETTRGCKHLCRHCPVVPVYQGRFRTVGVDVVIADIANQVAAGAQHISFGDPDFFNGPTHAKRVLTEMRQQFPDITFDATIKVEHLIKHADDLPLLREAGCAFVISAVEAVDDDILLALDKGHTNADFALAVQLTRDAGIALSPTFVPFSPWTTLDGYRALLERIVELRLVEAVAPIQLAIRLLIPQGSRLLELDGFEARLQPFDGATLGYPWRHEDPNVDALQRQIMQYVSQPENAEQSRRQMFEHIWQLAHDANQVAAPTLPEGLGSTIPHHSEPWYCCAEPTEQQLISF